MDKLRRLFFSQTSKDTFVSMIGLGVTAFVGMLFTILTARTLGTERFGVFSALNALVTIFASMGDFGISSAMVNFLPKMKEDRASIVSVAFWFQTGVALVFGLGLCALSLIHQYIVPGSTTIDFYMIGILTGAYIFQGLSIGIFNAERNFFAASFVQSSDSVLKFALAATFSFLSFLTIPLALLANIISCLFSIVYGLLGEFKNIKPIFPREQVVSIFKFARWIALSRVFSVAVSRVDILLLNLLVGGFQAGIFAAASRITLLFALLVSSLGSVIAPRFSSFNKKQEVLSYLRKVSLLVGSICLLMLGTIVIAKPLILFVFGTKYLAAVPVFRYLTLAMIPFLLSVITSQPLIYSYNQPNFFAFTTIIQVSLIVVLDLILIPKFQASAPAISLAVANTFVLAVSGLKLATIINNSN